MSSYSWQGGASEAAAVWSNKTHNCLPRRPFMSHCPRVVMVSYLSSAFEFPLTQPKPWLNADHHHVSLLFLILKGSGFEFSILSPIQIICNKIRPLDNPVAFCLDIHPHTLTHPPAHTPFTHRDSIPFKFPVYCPRVDKAIPFRFRRQIAIDKEWTGSPF